MLRDAQGNAGGESSVLHPRIPVGGLFGKLTLIYFGDPHEWKHESAPALGYTNSVCPEWTGSRFVSKNSTRSRGEIKMNWLRLCKMSVGGMALYLAVLCLSQPLQAQINQAISITCTGNGQLCTPFYSTTVNAPQAGA